VIVRYIVHRFAVSFFGRPNCCVVKLELLHWKLTYCMSLLCTLEPNFAFLLTGTTGFASAFECTSRTHFANTACNNSRWAAEWHSVWPDAIAVVGWSRRPAEAKWQLDRKYTAVNYDETQRASAHRVNDWWIGVAGWKTSDSAVCCNEWSWSVRTTTTKGMLVFLFRKWMSMSVSKSVVDLYSAEWWDK